MELIRRYLWAFGLVGFLAAVGALSVRFVLGDLGTAGTLLALLATVSLAVWALVERPMLSAGVRSRAFRHGAGAVGLVALAALLSLGVFVLTSRHDHRWDWTRGSRYTVSEQTLSVVSSLDRDVKVLAFFREGSPEVQAFQALMEGYQQASAHVEVRIVDPVRNPRLAEQHAVTSDYGTVIFESGNARQRVESGFGEEALTDALIRLLSGSDHEICWITGHGEADPDDDVSAAGLGVAVLKLEDQNYRFTKDDLLTEGIHDTCEAVLVVGPRTDWGVEEREDLATYLAQGGRALVMFEAGTVPELAEDFARYGLSVGDDLVIDPDRRARSSVSDDPAFLVVVPEHYAIHPAVAGVGAPVLFGMSRSVSGVAGTEGLAIHELIAAGPDSWGETSLDVDPVENPNAWMPEPGIEKVGDVSVGVAVTVTDPSTLGAPGAETAPGGRLVVYGSTDFARNFLVHRAGNQDLFAHAIAWLVEEDAQLAAGPKGDGDVLDLSVIRSAFLFLLSVIFVPGAALAAAVLAAMRRRLL